jgi:hypothetical protein
MNRIRAKAASREYGGLPADHTGGDAIMFYAWLADAVVAIHVAYVSFVIFGQLAILIGAARRWSWIRNRTFRLVHLVAIVVVASEAVLGIPCPLTVWESDLRRLAGQQAAEGTFIGRWLHDLLFFEFPPWVFTTAYVSFALLVLGTLLLVPPRRSHEVSTAEATFVAPSR